MASTFAKIRSLFNLDIERPTLSKSMRYNWQVFKEQPIQEIAGCLGDLGTFLPLTIALASAGCISLTSTLIFSGLFNALSGAFFGVPMCVQPMKVLAAVAIAKPFTLHETMAAGIGVGAIVGGLSIMGLVELASRFVPRPVVKGIQLGAGLTLIINSGTTLLKLKWVEKWNDNLLWAMGVFILLYATSRMHRFPFALLIFILGLIFAIIILAPQRKLPRGGIYRPHTTVPTSSDFRVGILSASLSQVPLTLLNSVLAVTALSAELLADRPVPSNTSLGLSVAAMNLFGCWFGAMPVCHGSGGLAAQHRFGARSGASVIILGLLKILLGVFFGSSLSSLLAAFPSAFLAVMIFASGMELLAVGRTVNEPRKQYGCHLVEDPKNSKSSTSSPRTSEHAHRSNTPSIAEVLPYDAESSGTHTKSYSETEQRDRWTVMMVTAAGTAATKNALVGFLMGIGVSVMYKMMDWWKKRMEQRNESE